MGRTTCFLLAFWLISLTGCGRSPALPQEAPPSADQSSENPEQAAASSEKTGSRPSPMSDGERLRATSPEFPRALPPAPSYLGWSGIVMRLEFEYREKRIKFLGTGFVIRDRNKQDYLLTCAHLIGERAWQQRYQVKMRTMNGQRLVDSFGASLHVGASVDLKQSGPNRWPDMTQDLVIRAVAGDWARPMPLARSDPVVGEWVWAVGCEASKPLSNEKLFLGQIVDVSYGGYVLKKIDQFDPHGFSGGPIVNTRGEVLGNVLAGRDPMVSGATVTVLRQRLQAKEIPLD